MKTSNNYNERLLKFAKHLEKITNHPEHDLIGETTLVDFVGNVRIPYQVKYQSWLFEELPVAFDEWGFGKFGNPLPEDVDEEENTVAAVIDFFDLSPDEFCFLFDVEGFQLVEQFGGNFLNFESDGPDFARNMYALVETRGNESSENLTN